MLTFIAKFLSGNVATQLRQSDGFLFQLCANFYSRYVRLSFLFVIVKKLSKSVDRNQRYCKQKWHSFCTPGAF